jgi:hypothetical protein
MIKKYYKWTLEDGDVTIIIPDKYKLPDFENEWVTIKDNVMTIRNGYSWDGCSPKRILFGKLIVGTWDGPIDPGTGKQVAYIPSLVHDILCQFEIGTRKRADRIFRYLLDLVDFKFKRLYYRAVRIFGFFVSF